MSYLVAVFLLWMDVWKLKDKAALKKSYQVAYYLKLKMLGSYVGHNCIFDGIPCLPHGLKGIFISGGSKIGRNCVIFQHVTIGGNSLADSKSMGAPIIGDNCYIGAGATIIGGIEIGNNCRIGAGAIVVEDIPDDSLVVMAKPTIIHKENMDNRFITYIDGKKVFFNNGKWERFDE